jgi:CubicO group peptidase (beta-lactamase class C family)
MRAIPLALAMLVITRADAGVAPPSDATRAWIAASAARWGFPGVSVAVIKDFAIEWAEGFGLSDQESGAPVTSETTFQAASVSKAVTAIAALIAASERGLNLDADVNTLLAQAGQVHPGEQWMLPNPFATGAAASLRRLLSHTAGTNSFHYSGYQYGYYAHPPAAIAPIPTLAQELTGSAPATTPAIAVDEEPGRHWRYSPAGYTVIQALLVDLYGAPFEAVMARLILRPLGMERSTFAQPVLDASIPAMAVPYQPAGRRLPIGPLVFPAAASGGMTSTPSDLARFAIAVQRALAGETTGWIPPAIARAAVERQAGTIEPSSACFATATPGRAACACSWGLGFDVNLDKYAEHQPDGAATGDYFGHTGFNSGFLSLLLASKTGGRGIVIMTNMAPLDMSGPVPQFPFLLDLVRRIADEEAWP